MVSEIWYTKDGVRTKAYSYLYNSDGKIAEFKNHITNNIDLYTYGTDGRLETVTRHNSSETYVNVSVEYGYNEKGWLSQVYRNFSYDFDSTLYIYDSRNYTEYTSDGKIDFISMDYDDERFGIVQYTYDSFNRINQKRYLSEYQPGEFVYQEFDNTVSYEYTENGSNTSLQISKYTSKVEYVGTTEYTYTYDANGNITKVNLSTGEEIRYVYDGIGQLIREDNGLTGYTYVYSYDNAGNITSSNKYTLTAEGVEPSGTSVSKTYGYTNDSWGDLLTSFNGHTITYDGIGNPLSYYNGTSYTFTWNGRQLTGATIGSNVYSFTYDDQGMRTSKTKDGKTVTYYYSGGLLIGEFCEDYGITYIYENDVSPIGMKYYDPDGAIDIYWFEKNLQGDIVAVYGDLWGICPTKFASYTYDAWGNATATYYNGGESKSVVNNPFLYRGYYYDSDLGLYYLGSRYYDSNTGRFISADGYVSTGQGLIGNNMFAYCGNNPVNFVDPNGMIRKKIGNFFSNTWKEIKTWAKNTFGAGSSESETIYKSEAQIIPDPSPVTIKAGTQTTKTVSEHGDDSKPISVYANKNTQDTVKSSSAGMNINISNFTLNLNLALDDISISGSLSNGNSTNSFGLKINLSEFKVGFESSTAIKWDNMTETAYTNYSVSGWALVTAYVLVTTGQYVGSPAHAY